MIAECTTELGYPHAVVKASLRVKLEGAVGLQVQLLGPVVREELRASDERMSVTLSSCYAVTLLVSSCAQIVVVLNETAPQELLYR